MKRRKKRKLKAFIKEFILITLPFSAGIFMNIGDIMGRLADKMDSIDIQVIKENKSYNGKISEDFEDIIISEGYGYSEESENFSEIQSDEIPIYKIVSDNAGAKPYPTEWTEGGSIVRTTYGHYDGTTFFDLDNGGQVNNKTSVSNETLKAESRLLPDFKIEDTEEPQVLIYHTHTTETYEPYVRDFYDANFNYRTTDETKNVIMVGNAIQKELESAGIGVIHSTEIHDYPSYNGAYDRSAETVNAILEQYPSIKVALDIHRDAICTES
ncbi:MAG: stage II sporulation protein P, partial [Ruminococcus sp.]